MLEPIFRHDTHCSSVGQPVARREAVLKVTGEARYAADHQAHSEALESELAEVTTDLNQIMETIAATLGVPIEDQWAMTA